jgi:hypothetical protein
MTSSLIWGSTNLIEVDKCFTIPSFDTKMQRLIRVWKIFDNETEEHLPFLNNLDLLFLELKLELN